MYTLRRIAERSALDSTLGRDIAEAENKISRSCASDATAELLQFLHKHPAEGADALDSALREGGESSLAVLESVMDPDIFGPAALKFVASRDLLRRRVSYFSPGRQPSPDAGTPRSGGSEKSLAVSIRAARGFDLVKSMQALTLRDPNGVCEFLVTRSPVQDSIAGVSGFSLTNFYGWHCNENRIENFRRLLAAQDPVVRAGGAVFLAGEDSHEGAQALRKAMTLPGFAGLWASVLMAGRGDKAAADSVIQHLADAYGEPYRTHWWNLRSSFFALLSNSARASALTPPPIKDIFEEFNSSSNKTRKATSRLRRWWGEVRTRIVLRDPWLINGAKAQL